MSAIEEDGWKGRVVSAACRSPVTLRTSGRTTRVRFPTGRSATMGCEGSGTEDRTTAILHELADAGSHPILQSFPHRAIIVFDHELRYLSSGGLGLVEVGLSRQILEGRTIFDVFPVEVSSAIEPLYRAALAGSESVLDVPFQGRI